MHRRQPVLAAALSLAASLAATALAPPRAGALVLCTRKAAGAVKVREACRKKERQVDVSQLGILGPPGEPGPAGPAGAQGAPPPGVRLVDANGTTVGFGAEAFGQVYFDVGGGELVQVFARRAGFEGGAIYFDQTGCAGPTFVLQESFRVGRVGNVQSGVIYYAGDPIANHNVKSYRTVAEPGGCEPGSVALPGGFCCTNYAVAANGGLALAFDLTPFGFTPPFHLEVAP